MNTEKEAPAGQGGGSNNLTKSICCASQYSANVVSNQARGFRSAGWVDFREVNEAALGRLPKLFTRWLPGGVRDGDEYTALNPTRIDRHLGSFRINLRTGRWADFATGDKGTDVISLAAYLAEITQYEAARRLAKMLGLRRA